MHITWHMYMVLDGNGAMTEIGWTGYTVQILTSCILLRAWDSGHHHIHFSLSDLFFSHVLLFYRTRTTTALLTSLAKSATLP